MDQISPYLFFSSLKCFLHSDIIITTIDIIITDELIKYSEFDCPWFKSLTCALVNYTVRNPDNLIVCINRYIKLSFTMNINHGINNRDVYCNFRTTAMKNGAIQVLFNAYAPFCLVRLFSGSWFLLFNVNWIFYSSLDNMYCWWKQDMDLDM